MSSSNATQLSDAHLPNIRQQYEELPYPPRSADEEKDRLLLSILADLATINHMCYGGQRNCYENFRVLVAGGGTGDATIYLAEQLRETKGEVVHLDMSTASIDVAKSRADARGLTNITFVHASLLDAANIDIGTFDHINCCGVLHHLKDPDAGLAALKSILNPNGSMAIMVYAKYGRSAYYMMQELMRYINVDAQDSQEKVDNLKGTLNSLHSQHWLKFSNQVRPVADLRDMNDAGLYDLLLHEQDVAYSIQEIYDWVGKHGLHVCGTPGLNGEQIMYLPETYIRDEALLAKIKKLPISRQYAIGELMYGQILKHTFFLTPEETTPADFDNLDLVPTLNVAKDSNLVKQLTGRVGDQLQFGMAQGSFGIRTTPAIVHTFKRMDNQRTLREIYTEVAEVLRVNHAMDKTVEDIKKELSTLLTMLFRTNMIRLQAPGLPVPKLLEELQGQMKR